ncbi:hypothetical protein I4U23_026291 [Adineta vaga]|nr:hypothetical protein I4U23_026291 [Adineta vaga]
MASIRSINSAKPPDRLLNSRVARASSSIASLSPKKLSLTKTTPIAVATTKRRKSSRMSSKKTLSTSKTSPGRLDLSSTFPSTTTTTTTTSQSDEIVNKMASTTINDIPSPSNTDLLSATSTASTMFEFDNSLLDNRPSEEPQYDLSASANLNETITSTSSSRKSSTQDIQFTINSFDIIRTVGTGTFGRVQLVCHRETNTFYALKLMSIRQVVESKQVEHVRNEKKILTMTDHPFLVRLQWTTHTNSLLYLLFEYLPGGELFQMMRKREKFDPKIGIFYASEVLLALDYLHHLDILYRDLKPENIILDIEGHIRLVDFGFAKQTKERTFTLCGTVDYLAPEVIQNRGHHKASDWWAFGILIYEMLAGYPPFYDSDQFAAYQKILSGKIVFPRHFDYAAKQLLRKLLNTDQSQRIGSAKNGGDEIKREQWFVGISWNDVYDRKVEPPIKPVVTSPGDATNFDSYDECDMKQLPAAARYEVQLFKDF